MKSINILELFAGVGGFRIGFENVDDNFKTIFANQFEPAKKKQQAYECYNKHFPNSINSNEDISKISNEFFSELEDVSLINAGFPCQDYSVARSLSNEQGIEGKKGVLFWDIKRIAEITKPKYLLLENVDRLLKCPSKQRGRDFGIILSTFRDMGYNVEWRVVNAADYGASQRRRRTFIFAYRNDLPFSEKQNTYTSESILFDEGFFAKTFPVSKEIYKKRNHEITLPEDIIEVSDTFTCEFHNAGYMKDGVVHTIDTIPVNIPYRTLGDVLEDNVDESYYLTEEQAQRFEYLRGAKKIERTSKDGHSYIFSEGALSPIDSLDLPSRTMLTSESSVNRTTHIIEVEGRKRFLTPVECERLNDFPDNWTADLPDRMRYFTMGNALVVSMIEKMAETIKAIEEDTF